MPIEKPNTKIKFLCGSQMNPNKNSQNKKKKKKKNEPNNTQ